MKYVISHAKTCRQCTLKIAAAFALLCQSRFERPTRRLKFQTRRYKRKQPEKMFAVNTWTQIAVLNNLRNACIV